MAVGRWLVSHTEGEEKSLEDYFGNGNLVMNG